MEFKFADVLPANRQRCTGCCPIVGETSEETSAVCFSRGAAICIFLFESLKMD